MALWCWPPSAVQPEVIGPLVMVDSRPFIAAIQNAAITAEAVKLMANKMCQQLVRFHELLSL